MDTRLWILERKAAAGDPTAQYNLGWGTMRRHFPREKGDAHINWIRRSADQDYPPAQAYLATLHSLRYRLEDDPEHLIQAYTWRLLASQTDDRPVPEWFYGNLDAHQRAEAQRRAREWRPIDERQGAADQLDPAQPTES